MIATDIKPAMKRTQRTPEALGTSRTLKAPGTPQACQGHKGHQGHQGHLRQIGPETPQASQSPKAHETSGTIRILRTHICMYQEHL